MIKNIFMYCLTDIKYRKDNTKQRAVKLSVSDDLLCYLYGLVIDKRLVAAVATHNDTSIFYNYDIIIDIKMIVRKCEFLLSHMADGIGSGFYVLFYIMVYFNYFRQYGFGFCCL